MSQTFEPLKLPFSTADAESPTLNFDRGELRVRFIDWREQEIRLLLRDVIAFSWDEGDAAWSEEHSDDLCFMVHSSEWLERHVAVGVITTVETHCHFKLCFNAAGVLQVLASRLDFVARTCRRGYGRFDMNRNQSANI